MRAISAYLVLVAVTVLMSACDRLPDAPGPVAVTLPDRTDAGVRREEARLARVLAVSGVVAEGTGIECDVRLLGREAGASFAWAECFGVHPGGIRNGASVPVRVEGEQVLRPRMGSEYAPSVRELFPPELATVILEDPESARPSSDRRP